MRGTVLSFNRGSEGVIDADDGKQYHFKPSDWKGWGYPEPGLRVEFECAADLAWNIDRVVDEETAAGT